MRKKPNKIGILSMPFAGSTLLASLLGAHTDITNLGELKELISDITLTADHGRPKCSFCRNVPIKCPFWDTPWADKLKDNPNLIDEIMQHVITPIMVDSSKLPEWFSKFIGPNYENADEWVFVHLFKTPSEQAASYKMRKSAAYMRAAQSCRIYQELNTSINKFLKQFKSASGTFLRFEYRTLCEQPADVLRLILTPFGLDFDKGMLEYWNSEQHYVSGNTYVIANFPGFEWTCVPGEDYNIDRYKKRRRTIFYDDKHLEVLDDHDLAIIHTHQKSTELLKQMRAAVNLPPLAKVKK